MAVTLTAELEAEKLAARLTVAGMPAGSDTVAIQRTSPSGAVAGVRGADPATVSGTSHIARDYELPLDTPVDYQATVYDGTTIVGTATASFEVSYGACDAWLTDLARPTNSLTVTIESLVELTYGIPSGIHRVLDRRDPIVTALVAWTPLAELLVLTETLDERDSVRNLLGSGYPFLLRTIPEQGIGNLYLAASQFVEERLLAPGDAALRRFRISCVQVERPDPTTYVPVAPNVYSNVRATYASYSALAAGVASYDELAYTYPTGSSPFPSWPPSDA